MNTPVQKVSKNTRGRDFIVGDIHGCFTLLAKAMDNIGFSAENGDRLFSVGDLVDRGPESITVLDFLKNDWVYAIAGNHEDMAIQWQRGVIERDIYEMNGGAWMTALDKETAREVADTLSILPYAIELETDNGIVGIVHAECPFDNWNHFVNELGSTGSTLRQQSVINCALWARDRIGSRNHFPTEGVVAVVCGHTPVRVPTKLGTHYFIETCGWRGGVFTFLNAKTLEIHA